MNIPESLVCPSCASRVKPLRRKVPRSNLENVSPLLEFGWFCPIDACGVRLEKAIAAQENESIVESEEIDPDDIPEDVLPHSEEPEIASVKPQPKKIIPIRPTKDSEDLFSRIPREHAEAIREESELRSRLAEVVVKREKLDRLIAAIFDLQSPIAAE